MHLKFHMIRKHQDEINNMHDVEGEFRCDKAKCDKTFNTEKLLNAHISVVHKNYNELAQVICEECGGVFKNKNNLKIHLDHVHKKVEKKFHCNICNKWYSFKVQLKNHKKFVHEGIREEVCDKCGKGFFTKCKLKAHLGTVHDVEAFKYNCHLCTKTFGTKYNLDTHVAGVHEKVRFECEFCENLSFSQKASLSTHIKRVHPEKVKIKN